MVTRLTNLPAFLKPLKEMKKKKKNYLKPLFENWMFSLIDFADLLFKLGLSNNWHIKIKALGSAIRFIERRVSL